MSIEVRLAKVSQQIEDHIRECNFRHKSTHDLLGDIKKSLTHVDARFYAYCHDDSRRWHRILLGLFFISLSTSGALVMFILKS